MMASKGYVKKITLSHLAAQARAAVPDHSGRPVCPQCKKIIAVFEGYRTVAKTKYHPQCAPKDSSQ